MPRIVKKASKIEVVKVPVDRPACRPKRFPRMPIMYLEAIENKDKIKAECIGVDYNPAKIEFVDTPNLVNEEDTQQVREDYKDPVDSSPDISDSEKEDRRDENPVTKSDDTRTREYPKKSDSSSDSDTSIRDRTRKTTRTPIQRDSDRSSTSSPEPILKSKTVERSDSEDEMTKRIKKMLKKSRTPPRATPSPSPPKNSQPAKPLFSEIKKGNGGSYPIYKNIDNPTVKEQEQEDLKRELLFKFELLKKTYKTADIPEYTVHSDYNTMLKNYEMTIKKISIDNNVENYRQYLVWGFMGIEFALGKYMSFDMSGFTQQQIVSMSSYEKLLIELGEKSYVPTSKNWPVEVRLLGVVLMNTAFFVMTKIMMKKTGENLFGVINNFNAGTTENNNQPKRKMKGPNIDLDEIP